MTSATKVHYFLTFYYLSLFVSIYYFGANQHPMVMAANKEQQQRPILMSSALKLPPPAANGTIPAQQLPLPTIGLPFLLPRDPQQQNFLLPMQTTATSDHQTTGGEQQPILVNQVPGLPFCRVGQRFIVNHILYVCHQYGEHRRGFKPFACAIRNRENSRMLARNGAIDDQFFRYKCQDAGDGALRLAALNCILNEIEIRAGQSLRRGRFEYVCVRDGQGQFKLIEKQMLHDFCLPGNRNETLLNDGDICPGITIGTIHANFGTGTEVIFDSQLMTIVPKEKKEQQSLVKANSKPNKAAVAVAAGTTVTITNSPMQNIATGGNASVELKKNKQNKQQQPKQQKLAHNVAAATPVAVVGVAEKQPI